MFFAAIAAFFVWRAWVWKDPDNFRFFDDPPVTDESSLVKVHRWFFVVVCMLAAGLASVQFVRTLP
jgi:hypothetical protein